MPVLEGTPADAREWCWRGTLVPQFALEDLRTKGEFDSFLRKSIEIQAWGITKSLTEKPIYPTDFRCQVWIDAGNGGYEALIVVKIREFSEKFTIDELNLYESDIQSRISYMLGAAVSSLLGGYVGNRGIAAAIVSPFREPPEVKYEIIRKPKCQ